MTMTTACVFMKNIHELVSQLIVMFLYNRLPVAQCVESGSQVGKASSLTMTTVEAFFVQASSVDDFLSTEVKL